jgi:riboflavin kinase/FMN adenylyltransferase
MHVFHSITTQHKIPLALTIGNFDGVHLGHQAMLERLKRAAKRLNIASCIMIFEPHPREFLMPNQSPASIACKFVTLTTHLHKFQHKLLLLTY